MIMSELYWTLFISCVSCCSRSFGVNSPRLSALYDPEHSTCGDIQLVWNSLLKFIKTGLRNTPDLGHIIVVGQPKYAESIVKPAHMPIVVRADFMTASAVGSDVLPRRFIHIFVGS